MLEYILCKRIDGKFKTCTCACVCMCLYNVGKAISSYQPQLYLTIKFLCVFFSLTHFHSRSLSLQTDN